MSGKGNFEFALLVVFSLVFWGNPLATTFRLAWTNEAYTHIILIIPLSLALIYFDSRTVRPAIQPSRFGGSFLLAGALALGCLARWVAVFAPDVRLTLSMCALVLWWIASMVFCFGIPVFRAFVFPVCFLFWLVPLPNSKRRTSVHFWRTSCFT